MPNNQRDNFPTPKELHLEAWLERKIARLPDDDCGCQFCVEFNASYPKHSPALQEAIETYRRGQGV